MNKWKGNFLVRCFQKRVNNPASIHSFFQQVIDVMSSISGRMAGDPI